MLVNHYGCDYPMHGINSEADALQYRESMSMNVGDKSVIEQNLHMHHDPDHGIELHAIEL